jgi:putative Holliday junction resolvase
MARLMALDIGTARIGIALSEGILASPYSTLHISRNEEQTRGAIQRLIEETEAEQLVVGLPISLDGAIHAQGERIQAFAERLRQHISIPLTFWDERYSTVEAQRLLQESGLSYQGRKQGPQRKKRKRGHEIDALAATVILQDYLDHLGNTAKDEHV